MPTLRHVLVWLTLGSACFHDAFAADVPVVIDTTPAVIVRRTFDPVNPPAEMPKLTPPEIGLCVSAFGCEMRMGTSTPEGRATSTMIESVRMTTRLTITIWTRIDAPAREVDHEEGHRAISEHYYAIAGSVARRLADRVVSQRLFHLVKPAAAAAAKGDDPVEAAIAMLQDQLLEEYLAESHWRCAFAQECFDDITDHGRNPITEETAISHAIAEEQAARSTKATVK